MVEGEAELDVASVPAGVPKSHVVRRHQFFVLISLNDSLHFCYTPRCWGQFLNKRLVSSAFIYYSQISHECSKRNNKKILGGKISLAKSRTKGTLPIPNAAVLYQGDGITANSHREFPFSIPPLSSTSTPSTLAPFSHDLPKFRQERCFGDVGAVVWIW